MLGAELSPLEYLNRCSIEFAKLDLSQVEELSQEIYDAYEDKRFVFICGNGGSGSNSSHFCAKTWGKVRSTQKISPTMTSNA